MHDEKENHAHSQAQSLHSMCHALRRLGAEHGLAETSGYADAAAILLGSMLNPALWRRWASFGVISLT
jgi:hypothetical protein